MAITRSVCVTALLLTLSSCSGGGSEPSIDMAPIDSSGSNIPGGGVGAPESPSATDNDMPQTPPLAGTIFMDANIINENDPSAFLTIRYLGTAQRQMFDRRVGWVIAEPYVFEASYDDGLFIEVQVNAEFSEDEAAVEAARYAWLYGQLPTLLRQGVDTSWIHRGVFPWGGGNRNLLVHTGQSERYLRDGIVEETLVHEATHSSLDEQYGTSAGWNAAQMADPTFISSYAQDFSSREDLAESFLPYVALRYRRDRISEELAATIEQTIPNRIQFFDGIVRDMYPLQ